MTRSRGPRPQDDTRRLILDSARKHFADKGYAGASLRAIARDAGVDPALVHHYFDGRAALYAAALAGSPFSDPDWLLKQVIDGPIEGLGERAARCFLEVWEDPESKSRFVTLFRSSCTDDGLVESREFLATRAFTALTEHLGLDRSALRAELAAAVLSGTAGHRYMLRDAALAMVSIDDLVATLAPHIQQLLVEPLPEAA
ncbi:TetR/AcrR family transcriptional regulator [Enemella evansiae]|uniref:TetR family transcriptional regulator n=1 Tax=Enemella evansiae TaxID=2016499 RepID=A0A255GP84_9ACTN|nr:TetR family transcriptional regulator [Enemella evansiae]PFG68969.1 TetR family transcriptional regulator [Propionibacteriaceae bacterium ES.041]OYN96922.1 TetR family transcriptional regulator [Enemella evansiae]OYO00645.1 TetR family transcriptional regulator [Enemella evansiae]OYO02702.1 TetR family transcriptional regulator [Enemella evansiae]OYO11924.1 TetR family transcriptional regulator [Enemella evansiae]